MIKLLSFLACFVFFSEVAYSAESNWATADEMQGRIITAIDNVANNTEIEAAIQIRQSPGWHSYWRSPGDSGLPPQFDWSGSINIKDIVVSYPTPKRFDEMGLTTFGYDGDLFFPVKITLEDADTPTKIHLKLDTMVCKDICIPQSIKTSLDLGTGEAKPSKHAPMIEFAKKKLPSPENTDAVRVESIVIESDAVVVNTHSSRGYNGADLFIEVGEYALTSDIEFVINDQNDKKAIATISISEDIQEEFFSAPSFASDVNVIATFTDGRNAVEQTLTIKP